MEIRRAGINDIDLLTENRVEFVSLIRNIQDPETFKNQTRQYLREHINDGSIICWICVDAGKIVSSCLLCVYTTIPIPSSINGKSGVLFNVYTLKKYRRQGLAKTLLNKLIEDARKVGVGKISLDFTDEGYYLYKSSGFVKNERTMELRL
ncbi:MAG TPA: GNAT family N-acetyltransferase [Ruminiclostridium sp.]|nr:GNAT family N-acetyltransferase [Ruminiclostridium sp.]